MSEWQTATQIQLEFVVGEAKLLTFARRGNLASRLDETGERLYSRRGVESLFVPRGSALLAQRDAAHFGTLGGVRLGVPADEENRRISHLPTKARTSTLPSPAPLDDDELLLTPLAG